MLTLIFSILLLVFMVKVIWFSIKATFSIAAILACVVLFPLLLIGLVVGGLIYIALPLLLIGGIAAFIADAT